MIDSPLAVVRAALPGLRGAAILDVGCGYGGFALTLAAEGAAATGIDPGENAVAAARLLAPGSRFDVGSAERLPYADAAFDAVVFINALHHVPEAGMERALHEAARVLRARGALVVFGPLASGGFFEATRRIEDETQIRAAAQAALGRVVAAGAFTTTRSFGFARREMFADCDAVLERVVRVDPARRAAIEADRPAIVAAILAAAQRSPEGSLAFEQPVKADILRPAGLASGEAP